MCTAVLQSFPRVCAWEIGSNYLTLPSLKRAGDKCFPTMRTCSLASASPIFGTVLSHRAECQQQQKAPTLKAGWQEIKNPMVQHLMWWRLISSGILLSNPRRALGTILFIVPAADCVYHASDNVLCTVDHAYFRTKIRCLLLPQDAARIRPTMLALGLAKAHILKRSGAAKSVDIRYISFFLSFRPRISTHSRK